jgi:hypothetical protein
MTTNKGIIYVDGPMSWIETQTPWTVHMSYDGLCHRGLTTKELAEGSYVDVGNDGCLAQFPVEVVRFGPDC